MSSQERKEVVAYLRGQKDNVKQISSAPVASSDKDAGPAIKRQRLDDGSAKGIGTEAVAQGQAEQTVGLAAFCYSLLQLDASFYRCRQSS